MKYDLHGYTGKKSVTKTAIYEYNHSQSIAPKAEYHGDTGGGARNWASAGLPSTIDYFLDVAGMPVVAGTPRYTTWCVKCRHWRYDQMATWCTIA